MKIIEQSAELIRITEGAELLIEQAARICYKSEDKITEDSYKKFVHNICHVHKHRSVLEHASATFKFITDRSVTHELVRHRLASYSQESTRYCNYQSKGLVFVRPVGMDDKYFDMWECAMTCAERYYLSLLEGGARPEQARSVLPNSLKTEIIVTANFREWLHIIDMRTSNHAHPMIRQLIGYANDILTMHCPVVFGGEDYDSQAVDSGNQEA